MSTLQKAVYLVENLRRRELPRSVDGGAKPNRTKMYLPRTIMKGLPDVQRKVLSRKNFSNGRESVHLRGVWCYIPQLLSCAAAGGFVEGALHGLGHLVGVEDGGRRGRWFG